MYKLLTMLLAFINSKRRRSTASAFANGNEALFLNKREKHHPLACVCVDGAIPGASLLRLKSYTLDLTSKDRGRRRQSATLLKWRALRVVLSWGVDEARGWHRVRACLDSSRLGRSWFCASVADLLSAFALSWPPSLPPPHPAT